MTWGSILVLAVIAVIVAAVVVKMIRDKKNGKSCCGGDCSLCGGACSACKSRDENKKAETKR